MRVEFKCLLNKRKSSKARADNNVIEVSMG